ncbi:MAG: response regulator [Rhizobiales bacterium PAR1]|nr:MAG: response regulator [Rhizobiales bacterium PAR1]
MTPALRVLIVEDEAMIAMLYTEVLAGLGHEVSTIARTEDEAVETARSFRPDMMIVDHHLHQGSGAAAVKRILADGYVPHVLVSGDFTGNETGSVCLQKPFNEAQLIRAIEVALARCPVLPAL